MSLPRQPAGALRASDEGRRVRLQGWVGRRRDMGELVFLTLRDRSGMVQVVFDRERSPSEAVDAAGQARGEDVVEIEGEVVLRAAGQRRGDMATGDIEIVASRLEFLSRSETPPFVVEDRTNATEELRLEYRYLDLRRPSMQKNIMLRDEIAFRVRRVLHERGFLEIETPMLTRSTPEGARDFLVPSRVHRGQFYALPQSPQLFKQLLMISGFEKYFQLARCFRDEDLRADRQFEFTQIDLEMSFPTEEDVFDAVEAFLVEAFAAAAISCERPFRASHLSRGDGALRHRPARSAVRPPARGPLGGLRRQRIRPVREGARRRGHGPRRCPCREERPSPARSWMSSRRSPGSTAPGDSCGSSGTPGSPRPPPSIFRTGCSRRSPARVESATGACS